MSDERDILLEGAGEEFFDRGPASEHADGLLDQTQADYFVGGAEFQWQQSQAEIQALKTELEATREALRRMSAECRRKTDEPK